MLLLLAMPAIAQEATARLEWEPSFIGTNQMRGYDLQANAPDGVAVPEGLSRPLYGALPLGEGGVLHVAVDAGTDPQLLWIDANLDGSMADSSSRAFSWNGSRWEAADTVLFKLEGEADALPVEFLFRLIDKRLYVSTRIHRRGSVVLADRVRPVGLVDGNGDMRFDDPGHDRVYLDTDGDGRIEDRKHTHEVLSIGTPFRIGKHVYVIKVPDALGGRIEFHRSSATPPPATPWECERLELEAAGDGSGDAVPHARAAKSAAKPADRIAAMYALHVMGAKKRGAVYLDRMQRDTDEDVVYRAAAYLAASGTAKPQILAAFRQREDLKLRRMIYEGATAGWRGEPDRKLMVAGVSDDSDITRRKALRHLWALGDPLARKAAEDFLNSGGYLSSLLKGSVRVLGAAGDKKAIEATFGRLISGSDTHRENTQQVLAGVRDPGGVKAMIGGLKSGAWQVRSTCALLLGPIAGDKVTTALVSAAKKERSGYVLGILVRALGDRGDMRAFPVLSKIARDAGSRARDDAITALARLGFDQAKVQGFFLKRLHSRRWEERVLGLEAAGRSGDRKLVPAILANLDHKVWQVRLVAVEALGLLRVKGTIEPLIARLDAEVSPRVRNAIAETLFRLTGTELFDIADAWRSWWAKNKDGFKVPADVPERKSSNAGTVASFYGLPVKTARVCFVLDRSESMAAVDPRSMSKRTRMETAVEQLLGAVKRLKNNARVNVVFFDSGWQAWKKKLIALSPEVRSALTAHVKKAKPQGATHLYGGLWQAFQNPGVDTIFLLSDGAPTAGERTATEDILASVARLNRIRRVAIHCVSIGTDSELLRRLAKQNAGTYARR